jgi:hypothetical protein
MPKPEGFKAHIRLAWDSFWESISATKLGNHLLGELPSAMKRAPILFIICVAAIAILFSKGCDKNSQITSLKSDKDYFQSQLTTAFQTNSALIQSYQLQFSTLNATIQDKQAHVSELIQERDKAQLSAQDAQNALASWIMLAKSGNTNTPLTERLDSLTEGLEENTKSLTNMLGASVSIIPKFDVSINGQKIPNSSFPYSIINLKRAREIFLTATNMGDVTVDRLTVYFGANLDQTNISSAGWDLSVEGAGLLGYLHSWKITAQDILGGGDIFNVSTLTISTNYTLPFFEGLVVVQSPYSKKQIYPVIFIFNNQ